MYCLMAAGVTRGSQAPGVGALIEIAALAMRFLLMSPGNIPRGSTVVYAEIPLGGPSSQGVVVSILAPPERRINRQPFDDRTEGAMTCVWECGLGRPMEGASDARAHTIEPRVPQLQPTMFVDAIPELAAERRRRLSEPYRNDAA